MSSEYLAKDIRCLRLPIHEELGAPPTMCKGTKWQSRLYAEVLRFPRDIPPAALLRLGKKISFSGHAGETKEARPIKGANDFGIIIKHLRHLPSVACVGYWYSRALSAFGRSSPEDFHGGRWKNVVWFTEFLWIEGDLDTGKLWLSFRGAGRLVVDNVVKFRRCTSIRVFGLATLE